MVNGAAPKTRSEVSELYESISPIRRGCSRPASSLACEQWLTCKLHAYQRQAVLWAKDREQHGADDEAAVSGGVLAEEMGLGKTVEVLALVMSHGRGPAPPPATGSHPCHSGLLRPESSPTGGIACGMCGKRSQPNESVHSGEGGWSCCGWCYLPHQPMESPPAAHQAPAPSLQMAPCPVPPHYKVRVKPPRAECPTGGGAWLSGINLPTCLATLIITPASIHRQWLQEIEKHAPALASRVLVYTGVTDLGGQERGVARHGSAFAHRLAEAFDRAWIVLTTYKVLKHELLYAGADEDEDADSAPAQGGPPSKRLRGQKRYAVPCSPLLLREWWRVVIDEAQAVQSKTATPKQLTRMAMRLSAQHRWCVTGTPLSEERGLLDAYDLLRFLGCRRDALDSRQAFERELLRPSSKDSILRLMRTLMWRTSQSCAYAMLRIPPPMQCTHAVTLCGAEHAWVMKDAREMGVSSPEDELPTPPRKAGTATSTTESDCAPATPPRDACSAPSDGPCSRPCSTPRTVTPRFELQRGLTHVQLSRSWTALGRSEAQIEMGTTIVHLEQLQRAAELLIRRKQVAELELCERLNMVASWHVTLGQSKQAREMYERVLRIEEWGIVEDESAGNQEDNAEETLRRWRLEKVHTLFRLLCLCHDAGDTLRAESISDDLRSLEEEMQRESKAAVISLAQVIDTHGQRMGEALRSIMALTHVDGQSTTQRDLVGTISAKPRTATSQSWIDHAADVIREALSIDMIDTNCVWALEVTRLSQQMHASRETALDSLQSLAAEVAAKMDADNDAHDAGSGRDGYEAGERVEATNSRVAGASGGVGASVDETAGGPSAGTINEGLRIPAAELAAPQRATEVPRGRAAARARGVVLDYWDVSLLERERLQRKQRATAKEYVVLARSGTAMDMERVGRMELLISAEGEARVLRAALHRLRDERARIEASADEGEGHAMLLNKLWTALLRESEAELRVRTQWALACMHHESADRTVEWYKMPRQLPDRVEALPADERAAALAVELDVARVGIDRGGEACMALEREIRELYEQRSADCLAERQATVPLDVWMCEAWAPASPQLLALAPSVHGTSLARFVTTSAAEHASLRARLAGLTGKCCALTLALRLALADWLRDRQQHSEPAGSFDPARALLSTRPEAMESKLHAVRHCMASVGLNAQSKLNAELVASWLLREVPECGAVPCAVIREASDAQSGAQLWEDTPVVAQPQSPYHVLPSGQRVECVSAVDDEKEWIHDGTVPVQGMYDGQVSGASYEPGPWTWLASRRVWTRDTFPHDVLVATPCGHAYSERFWAAILSTSIDRTGARTYRTHKARCCAPLEGGGQCGRSLSESQGLRVTACRARRCFYSKVHKQDGTQSATLDVHNHSPLGVAHTEMSELSDLSKVVIHGSWGSRIDQVVRLLLTLRHHAAVLNEPQAAKAVVFSRYEPVLRLLAAACAMNGVRATRYGQNASHNEISSFLADASMQALLLSAHRDASGLTLTEASHVIIIEPQPDAAVEQQMIGRVHRIGQSRQTYVHRIVVDGTFEVKIAGERLQQPMS